MSAISGNPPTQSYASRRTTSPDRRSRSAEPRTSIHEPRDQRQPPALAVDRDIEAAHARHSKRARRGQVGLPRRQAVVRMRNTSTSPVAARAPACICVARPHHDTITGWHVARDRDGRVARTRPDDHSWPRACSGPSARRLAPMRSASSTRGRYRELTRCVCRVFGPIRRAPEAAARLNRGRTVACSPKRKSPAPRRFLRDRSTRGVPLVACRLALDLSDIVQPPIIVENLSGAAPASMRSRSAGRSRAARRTRRRTAHATSRPCSRS